MSRGGSARGDAGSTLVLTIGYAAFALVVILVVAAATSLYIERKRLLGLADSAALVGAEAFELDDLAVERSADGGEAVAVTLRPESVDAAVRSYLDRIGPGRFEGLRLERASTEDGRSATVSVSAWWRPPVLTLFLPQGVRLDATSEARSVIR